jgi:hypothetical protein
MAIGILYGLVKKTSQYLAGFSEVRRINAVANARPIDGALDQAALLKLLQMLGNGGLRQRKLSHNIPADTGSALGQVTQYRNTGWMRDTFSKTGDLLIPVFKNRSFVDSHKLSSYIANLRLIIINQKFAKDSLSPPSYRFSDN